MLTHAGRRCVGAVLVALLVGQNPARGKSQIQRADRGVTLAGSQRELERLFAAAALVQSQKEFAPSFRARRSLSERAPDDYAVRRASSADLGGAVGRGAERASHVLSEWVRSEDGGYSRFAADDVNPSGRKHRRAAAERATQRLARRGLHSSSSRDNTAERKASEDYGVCRRRTPELGRSPAEFDLSSLFATNPASPAARSRRGVIPLPGNRLGAWDPRLRLPSPGTGHGNGPIPPSDARFHGGNPVPPTVSGSGDPPPGESASGRNSGEGEGDDEGDVGVDEERNGNEEDSNEGGEAGESGNVAGSPDGPLAVPVVNVATEPDERVNPGPNVETVRGGNGPGTPEPPPAPSGGGGGGQVGEGCPAGDNVAGDAPEAGEHGVCGGNTTAAVNESFQGDSG